MSLQLSAPKIGQVEKSPSRTDQTEDIYPKQNDLYSKSVLYDNSYNRNRLHLDVGESYKSPFNETHNYQSSSLVGNSVERDRLDNKLDKSYNYIYGEPSILKNTPRSQLHASQVRGTPRAVGYSQEFVDQLERQYERSQADSLSRLRLAEENAQRTVDSLKTQITSLKQQISLNNEHHGQEMRRLHEKYKFEIETSHSNKEAQLASQDGKIQQLKKQQDDEAMRQNQLREEALQGKLNSNEELSATRHEIKKKNAELEDLRHQYFVVQNDQLHQLQKDKSDLKENFDNSILRLREQHNKDVTDLREEIRRSKELTFELEREISKLHKDHELKMVAAREDAEALHESLRSGRKLNELQLEENRRLSKTVEQYRKENTILTKEISLLESESQRLRQDNDDLRASVIRLDRLVYGRTKSPSGKRK